MQHNNFEIQATTVADLAGDAHLKLLDDSWKNSDTKCGAPHHDKPVGIDLNFGFFPDLKLEGFDQPAAGYHETTPWDSVKSIFSHKETLDDQIKSKVIKDLDPKSRQLYEQENKELEQYESARRSWALGTMYPPPPPPEAPRTPMHALVDIKTSEARDQILGAVRADMTTSEKARLAEQMNSYSNGLADAMERCNPMVPEPLMPLTKPGDAVKDFWDRIRERTDAFTKS